MVFLSHLSFVNDRASPDFKHFYETYLSEGFIGVSFFFVLSGFILAYNYKQKFGEHTISHKRFFIARLARIYPLHLLTFILAIPFTYSIFLKTPFVWSLTALANALLFQSYIPVKQVFFSFNDVSWSISDEMFFYASFPLLIVFFNKLNKNKLLKYSLLLLLIVPILSFLINSNYTNALFYVNPIFRVSEFVMGILLFYFTESKALRYPLFWQLFAMGVFLLFFLDHQNVPMIYRKSWYYWLPVVLLIYSFSDVSSNSILSRLISNKWLVLLGDISFSFYLLQRILFRYLLLLNDRALHIQSQLFLVLFDFVLLVGFSYLSYTYFEKPANLYVKKVFKES
jgi:peptidoglycan/LPS O-acetylase OafA/YrhL